jgi:hypothetical protein
MPVLTVVTHYVTAALGRATFEQVEEGVIGATVPDLPGLIAFGASKEECGRELAGRLLDFIKLSLERGHRLPVLDGIDLNSEAGQILASYHDFADEKSRTAGRKIYRDEAEFEAALDSWAASA